MSNTVIIVEKRNDAIKLQGIYGWQKAKPVKEIKAGDTLKWNFGYTSKVIDILQSKTGKTYIVTTRSTDSGHIYERRMGANRLVAYE